MQGRWGSWRELLVAAKDSFWDGGRAEPGSEYCFTALVAAPAAAPMKKRVFLRDFLGSYRLGAPPQWHFAGCLRPFARFGPRVLWPGS